MARSVHVGVVPNLVYIPVCASCRYCFQSRERNQDNFVAVPCDISLWHGNIRAMRVSWDWIQCCSPSLISESATESPLAVVLNLWGKQGRMISPSLSPHFTPSGQLQQLWRILNSLWMLKKTQFCCYICQVSSM